MAHPFNADEINQWLSWYSSSAQAYGQRPDLGAGSQPRRVPSYSGLVLDDDRYGDPYGDQDDSQSTYTVTTASTANRTAVSSVWTRRTSASHPSIAGRGESPPPRGHAHQPLEAFFQNQNHHHDHPLQGHHHNNQHLWCEFSELLNCRCP